MEELPLVTKLKTLSSQLATIEVHIQYRECFHVCTTITFIVVTALNQFITVAIIL